MKDGIVRAVNGLEENLCAPASLREKNKFQPVASLDADKPPLHRGIGLASPDAGVIADLRALGRGTALDSARVAAATPRR